MRTWLVVDEVVAWDEGCCKPELLEALEDDPGVPTDELLNALCEFAAA